MNNNSKSIFLTTHFLTFNPRAPLDYFQFETFVKFFRFGSFCRRLDRSNPENTNVTPTKNKKK